MDRTFCCVFAQSQCTTACNGASCYANCNAKCGLFGIFNCGSWTCSSIQSNCVTTTTTTITTTTTTPATTTSNCTPTRTTFTTRQLQPPPLELNPPIQLSLNL